MQRLIRRVASTTIRRRPGIEIAEEQAGGEALSVDIVLGEMRKTLEEQQTHISTLDIKASFFLTSASIIIGFAGVRTAGSDSPEIGAGWLAVAMGLFLALLVSVIQAYRLRGYSPIGLDPNILPLYLFEEPEYTKRQLIAIWRDVHEENVPQILRKTRWLRLAQWVYAIQVGYLAFVLIGHSQSDHIRPRWDDFLHWLT